MSTNALAERIIDHHQKAQASAANAVAHAIAAGELLAEAKAHLEHGAWIPYLENIGIAPRQAQRYMRLARHLPNASRVSSLSLRSALAEITQPHPDRSILSGPKERIASYSPWYDMQMALVLLLFADGMDVDAIAERTGFDPHEISCTVAPRTHSLSESAWYVVASIMSDAIDKAIWRAPDERMTHVVPVLRILRKQWTHHLPEPGEMGMALTAGRQAVGLDRHLPPAPGLNAQTGELTYEQ
ncbi:DUF3102 domain-containing protein [Acidithiobacillus sulfuriphilus]|uniref:DUF3102 domain-containing protein n=1 Tax=Acidithiobacillus sulfuriphilus TaxID=1867749 RepID=UPI003F631321